MKKNILATLSLVALTVFSAAAQTDVQRYRSVNAQLFGPPNAISLNYDARFKQSSQWGYSAGLGFGYYQTSYFLAGEASTRMYSLPLNINYLVFKHRHTMELGVGVVPGIHNEHTYAGEVLPSGQVLLTPVRNNVFNAMATFNAGYRFTATKGFQLRIGLALGHTLTHGHEVDYKLCFAPYFSFGKAF